MPKSRCLQARSVAALIGWALLAAASTATGQSLRFFGHGGSMGEDFVFPDRVKIDRRPPAAVNLGDGDFTVEFFLRAIASENPNTAPCGSGNDWVNSNIVIDADRFNQNRAWGIGLLNGVVVFGLIDEFGSGLTLCGSTSPLDDAWHHVAVDRRAADGRMRIFLDGTLDAESAPGAGPTGSVAYPVGAVPGAFCSPDGGSGTESCAQSDPFLVFGAEKHGFQGINYSGHLDEVRLSDALRYPGAFSVPDAPFVPDATTAALYHFDEGSGASVADASAGTATGALFFGGTAPAGPVWSTQSPFATPVPASKGAWRLGIMAAIIAAGLGRARARHDRSRRGASRPIDSRKET